MLDVPCWLFFSTSSISVQLPCSCQVAALPTYVHYYYMYLVYTVYDIHKYRSTLASGNSKLKANAPS